MLVALTVPGVREERARRASDRAEGQRRPGQQASDVHAGGVRAAGAGDNLLPAARGAPAADVTISSWHSSDDAPGL